MRSSSPFKGFHLITGVCLPRLSNHSNTLSDRQQVRFRHALASGVDRTHSDGLRRSQALAGATPAASPLHNTRVDLGSSALGVAATVVSLQPCLHHQLRFLEAGEVLLPNALLLETAKEALEQPVLLRRVGRDVIQRIRTMKERFTGLEAETPV